MSSTGSVLSSAERAGVVPGLGCSGQQGAQPVWDVCGAHAVQGGSGPPLLFGNSQPCWFQVCFGSCPNPASAAPLARRSQPL